MDPKPGRRRDIDSDDEEEVGRIQDELSPETRCWHGNAIEYGTAVNIPMVLCFTTFICHDMHWVNPADPGQLQERFLDTFSNWIGSSGVHLRAFCRGNFYLILPSEKETDLVSFSAFCIVLHHVWCCVLRTLCLLSFVVALQPACFASGPKNG